MRCFFKITIKCPSQSQSAQNKLKAPIYKITKCPYQILEHPYQNQSFQNNFKGSKLDLKVQISNQSAHINFKGCPLLNIQSQGETPPLPQISNPKSKENPLSNLKGETTRESKSSNIKTILKTIMIQSAHPPTISNHNERKLYHKSKDIKIIKEPNTVQSAHR